ncbi:RNA polymerase sigma-70 factor [Arenibacter sp. ARW7G5Y1]|uniref:RNA polymerase sigma-70 factor n=1 Tax=Arenibacter sp. ARW7G5Y1 TaxID=2135619 RepID=UPI000D76220C|nr:RNA polymerase sigma-70 factor [Arenibacter sp. ARW7G5Y1]PXX30595.1 RNA polymerase sigma-70 factor (ECF subfamily) [Arenibacter sp. ARW7G5Y1]
MLDIFGKNIFENKKKLETLVKKEPEFVFETIFRLYYDKLFQIAKIYLNNKEDAEEIVQNVFLKLWDKLNLLTGINNINSYLFTLTKNACLNFLKHRKIRSNFHNNKKEAIQIQYLRSETESLLLENELQTKIDEGIEALPEKCKLIFIQSRFEGLKNAEIAAIHGISKKTVDNQISKGIKHLRLHLKEFTLLFL